MLSRINDLLSQNQSFSFETTLSSKNYKSHVLRAKTQGYRVTLLFFWLQSIELAKERVKTRVAEGGHDIAEIVIERRYIRGIKNLIDIYLPIVDAVLIFDNSFGNHQLIAKTNNRNQLEIIDILRWQKIKEIYENP